MACGVVAFIDTFLPWASASALGISITVSAWTVGFWAWFPMILLLAVGVAAFLPGLGVHSVPELPLVALGVAALALIIVLIRWATYPSGLGAGVGLIVGLVLAAAVGVTVYLAPGGTKSGRGETASPGAAARPADPRPSRAEPPAPSRLDRRTSHPRDLIPPGIHLAGHSAGARFSAAIRHVVPGPGLSAPEIKEE